MIIKQLNYNKIDNTTNTLNCLNKDKNILRNIPHQPGEFSSIMNIIKIQNS